MVSVTMFTLVMLVATSSVFAIVESNKKSHSLKSVMTNLNFALESMMRDIRVGSEYQCDGGSDCNGGSVFSFKSNRDINESGTYDSNDRVEFRELNQRIQKSILAGDVSYITAEEIRIDSMDFYLIGAGVADGKQPKVVISIKGSSGTGQTRSEFNIQTTVSQRVLDQ